MIQLLIVIINIICSLYGAYTDIREGRIPNWLNMTLLIFNICLGLIMTYILNMITLNYLFSCFGLGLLIAFFSYLFKIWAPGDAKLFGNNFMGLSLVINNINPFNMMFNIMFIPLISVLFQVIFKTSLSDKIAATLKVIKESLIKTIMIINILVCISFNISIILKVILNPLEIFILSLGIILVLRSSIIKIYNKYFKHIIIISSIAIFHNIIYFPINLWIILAVVLIVVIIVQIIKNVDINIFYINIM